MKPVRLTALAALGLTPALAAQTSDSLASSARIFPSPFAFHQPEAKIGGGVGMLIASRLAPGARLVPFGSVGQVMASWSDLRPGDFHPGGGVRGRLLFFRAEAF